MRPIAILLAIAVTAVVLPASAAGSSTQRVLFEAPHALLFGDAATRDRAFDDLHELGVTDLRVVLTWKRVAPQPRSRSVPGFHERDPDAYDWGAYGPALDEARRRGLRVLLTISGPVPVWATAHRRDDRTRPSTEHFRRFVEAVARRFGRDVDAYAVWNEPNHPKFLLPQYEHGHTASGAIYRGLYLAARRGLKAAGQWRRTLLFGETAPRGTSTAVAPLRFLRQALCVTSTGRRRRGCGLLHVDGIAHHPYTTKAGPTFVPPGRDDVTIGVLGRLVRFLRTAEHARAIPSGTPIALTEFGIQSRPDPYVGVSYTTQAESRSISELLARRQSRVTYFSQYLLRDDAPVAGPATRRYSGFETGLRRADGTPKRAYDAFRLPLVARPDGRRRVALWGLVRPARAVTSVEVQFTPRGGRRWHHLKTLTTTPAGTWSTRTVRHGDRRYRVVWRTPDGSVVAGPLTRIRKVTQ